MNSPRFEVRVDANEAPEVAEDVWSFETYEEAAKFMKEQYEGGIEYQMYLLDLELALTFAYVE